MLPVLIYQRKWRSASITAVTLPITTGKTRIWDRNADLNVEGVRTLIKITAEQGILKEPLPQPGKYIDQSYLKEALAETGKK